jgi:hypothetical protein
MVSSVVEIRVNVRFKFRLSDFVAVPAIDRSAELPPRQD